MQSKNGKARVAIPNYYYKNILRIENGKVHSITFFLPHNDEYQGTSWAEMMPIIKNSVILMASVDDKASITLHPGLDRADVEESNQGSSWDFDIGKSNFSKSCKT